MTRAEEDIMLARITARIREQLLAGFKAKFGLGLSENASTIAGTLSFARPDGLDFTDHQRIWIEAWDQGCIIGSMIAFKEAQS